MGRLRAGLPGYAFYGYRLAQQLSTALGLLVLGLALRHWVRRTPPRTDVRAVQTRGRIGVVLATVLGMVAMLIGAGIESTGPAEGLRSVVWHCVTGGALGFAVGVVGHAAVWHRQRAG